MNYYMADTPGRLRIESPALKSGSPDLERFRDFITHIPDVSSVKMRPEIGSATILYDPKKLDHAKLIELLDKSGYFDHAKAKTPDDYLEKGIEKIGEAAASVVENEI
ncbi:MAG: HMA2 domain-containing protein [Syntrophorhabdales bacterium]|jgi:copper chaperone CopZ